MRWETNLPARFPAAKAFSPLFEIANALVCFDHLCVRTKS
jgi:hypothetical protein